MAPGLKRQTVIFKDTFVLQGMPRIVERDIFALKAGVCERTRADPQPNSTVGLEEGETVTN